MYIYLIQEEGDSFCVQAPTMGEACKCAEKIWINENCDDDIKAGAMKHNEASALYGREILQSCSFVGELKNPATKQD